MAVYDLWVPDFFFFNNLLKLILFVTHCAAHSNVHLGIDNFIEMQIIDIIRRSLKIIYMHHALQTIKHYEKKHSQTSFSINVVSIIQIHLT